MSNSIRPYLGILPTLGARVFVDSAAVVIGNVTLGDDCSVWPMAVIRGDVNTIRVGARTSIQDGSVLHVTSPNPAYPQGIPLTIGDDVTVGHSVTLHACTISNYCLIGMGSIVLDDVHVEEFVLIGAGSVVTPRTRLATKGLYVGNPARRIRDLKDSEIETIKRSASHYVKVKDNYL
ncbi:MAG: gamma carbonic anhydrase family protein [Candidatus Obscuribacterales bacterium]|nr:gamma carbonic anhydrase family protein [Steroidobacteraceae bacterium]